MSNRNGDAGTRWAETVARYLTTWWPKIERRAQHGTLDRGDLINGPADWTLEAKNVGRIDLPGHMREAKTEAANAGTRWWAVIYKARRGPKSTGHVADGYVVIPLHIAAELWAELEKKEQP